MRLGRLSIIMLLLFLSGCATTGMPMFVDTAATQSIQEGRIYIGMSKSEFVKILRPPLFGISTEVTSNGTKEAWHYGNEFYNNWNKTYTFYFENDKLVSWRTD